MLLILAALGCSGDSTPPAVNPGGNPEAGGPGSPGGPGGPGGPGSPGGNPEAGNVTGPPPVTKGTISTAELKLIQVKNGSAEVGATITGVTGSLDFSPGVAAGELKIDVSTWASGNEGRDNNVRGTFFQAVEHPEATFTLESLENLPEKPLLIDTEANAVAKGTLSMYAGSVPVSANIKISRTETGYSLQTTEDLTVSIEGLGMSENLTALMALCAHQSVDDTVRIGVNLTLTTD